jgi:hypothetical protein
MFAATLKPELLRELSLRQTSQVESFYLLLLIANAIVGLPLNLCRATPPVKGQV